ncbi:MAG TPA: class I SAM-dependent methyltransferase [Nevskia sp.]|nr:class I SAM-dependent methyltransferase [Nevskia sp.]
MKTPLRLLLGPRESDAISPTAHYTGYVWYRNGLSHPGLVTPEGKALYHGLRPLNAASGTIGGPTLEGFLLARHRAIDELLDQAIREGRVGQVIEVAAGLSPRGWDFARRYGRKLRYIEADLPDMARRKRERLEAAGLLTSRHSVVALDALADGGALSLAALAKKLDRKKGLAIITEGLLNYFDTDAVLGMWQRFAGVLKLFPQGLYFSDLHVASENRGAGTRAFGKALGSFVRGKVYLHFSSVAEAEAALRRSGFNSARLISPPAQALKDSGIDSKGAKLVRVIDAAT